MWGKSAFFFLIVLCLHFSCTVPAVAGPLFPCVKAASSSNGNFLVLTDVQLGKAQGNTAKIQGVSLRVFPKEVFVNANDRLIAPTTYWADSPQWSVVLGADQLQNDGCPLALITDDGEFLVLLSIGPVFDDTPVLRIYRRRDHRGDPVRKGPDHGVFIKAIRLKEIWPIAELGVTGWTDETPQWFVCRDPCLNKAGRWR